MKNEKFDDLRPYYDEEIAPAMHRIAASEHFPALSSFVYPDRTVEEVSRMLKSYTTIEDFQLQVMKAVNEQIIARSIRRFSYEGIDKLDKKKTYLFISNHRDIVLDATLLQYALHCSGHRTSEITFGSNLMSSPLIIDIGKSNKMFKVIRGGSAKDFYTNSLHLSEYIRYTLLEKKESVWIAQRNGRTKDGIDTTDQGIIKLFYMNHSEHPVQALLDLQIVPVSISYQWESCDILKARELYRLRQMGNYVKTPGEDLHSMLTGITQEKGDTHIAIGRPLQESDLKPFAGLPNNKFNKQVAGLSDTQIRTNYRLMSNHYIAHDLRSQSETYASHYTQAEKEKFLQHYRYAIATTETEDKKLLEDLFLGIYANPVDTQVHL